MVTEGKKNPALGFVGFFVGFFFFFFLWGTEENQQENCLKSSWQDGLESAFVWAASDLL